MAKHMQPLCPIRNDAKCMGAACALSRHVADSVAGKVFACALVDNGETQKHGLAVVDMRQKNDDPIFRT